HPYNPGDTPEKVDPYVGRVWSSWVSGERAPQAQALQPSERAISVLNFLHTLEEYGVPDWTVYARVVDSTGRDANGDIVFTAAFTRRTKDKVITHFVAFNPGWTTRYVNFYRIAPNGALDTTSPLNEGGPLAVAPKKMAMVMKEYPNPNPSTE